MEGSELTVINPLTGMRTKIFKCAECGMTLSQKCHLRAHVRIHSGEKPFKCEECGAAFAEKGNLGRHLRIHANDRPYVCQLCGDAFAHMGSLSRHRRVKHRIKKQFSCHLCSSTFSQMSGLELHMLTKHPMNISNFSSNKSFTCLECGGVFSQAVDLAIHSYGEHKFQQHIEGFTSDVSFENATNNKYIIIDDLDLVNKSIRNLAPITNAATTEEPNRSSAASESNLLMTNSTSFEVTLNSIKVEDADRLCDTVENVKDKNRTSVAINVENELMKPHDLASGSSSSRLEVENLQLKVENGQLKTENELLKLEICWLKTENKRLLSLKGENTIATDGS